MKMNKEEYFKRVRGILLPETLRKLVVFVIGVGSGGARVAIELGRLGVQLFLIDRPNERLGEHNIIRHPLGYDQLGQPKNAGVRRYIRNLNPSVKVRDGSGAVSSCEGQFAQFFERTHA